MSEVVGNRESTAPGAAAAPSRVREFVKAPFGLVLRHRAMLFQTVRSDIRARYAGSVLGLAWLLLYPLLFLGAYSLVYIYIFNARFGLYNSHEYVLHIFCGLVPFLAFAESLAVGVPSVTGNSNLIRNTLFPVELVPVKAVLASQCTHLAAAGMLFLALGVCGRLTVYAALFPLVFAAQLLFAIGVIWVLSSINVFVRDLQNAVAIVTLLLMLVSPIAYSVSDLPPAVHRIVLANPLYYIIVSWQQLLMAGRLPAGALAVLCAMSLACACLGLGFFRKVKRAFADNV